MIPAINEAGQLGACLERLPAAAEVVVSDGGSADDTVAIAKRHGAQVVEGSPGRGAQLNRGARAAAAPALLFLHADTRLPPQAVSQIREILDRGAAGGGFRVAFASSRPIYRLGSAIVNVRTRLTRAPLGDQAQFAARRTFEAARGFPEWPILEDLAFIRRLRRQGPVRIAPGAVTTSTRRFERRGIARTVATNWLIFALYFAGADPRRLARLYRNVR